MLTPKGPSVPKHCKSTILFIYLSVIVLLGFLIFSEACTKKTSDLSPIRIGWQIAWATQGQITHVLKHTNILELNGLKGELKGFSYGAPLNEAALAGEIDLAFVADQPAASLISRDPKWKIVARLIDFRAAIIVPPESDITQVSDLKSKTLAIPFGSTTHRIVLGMLKNAGLDPEKDSKVINMDIMEQAGVVLAGTKKEWKSGVDALASWDPNIAIFEDKGLARVLKHDIGLAVVVVSEEYINKYPESAVSFLKAYIEAYFYYVTHQQQANGWFAKEARIEFDSSLLDIAASFEPNLKAKSVMDIDVNLYNRHITMMKEGANFAFSLKLMTTKPNMEAATDTSLLYNAITALQENQLELSKIQTQ